MCAVVCVCACVCVCVCVCVYMFEIILINNLDIIKNIHGRVKYKEIYLLGTCSVMKG